MQHTNELLRKYRDNTLTPAELAQLRTVVAEASDAQLEAILNDDWLHGERTDSPFTAEDVNRLKKRLMDDIRPVRHESRMWMVARRAVLVAAAVLVPLLIITTLHFYHASKSVAEDQVAIATGQGEKASVSLPDGSTVRLNARSRLSYRVADFSGDTRQVSLTGEGYFDVAKDTSHPFMVNGRDYDVTVKGTKFNVSAYDQSTEVVVALDEGNVTLTARKSGGSVYMVAGDVSRIDRRTGLLSVTHNDHMTDNTAWKRNEIVLRHASLDQLLDRLAQEYGVTFHQQISPVPTSTFTGTLPSNNINEALDIIERVYHAKATFDGHTVTLRGL